MIRHTICDLRSRHWAAVRRECIREHVDVDGQRVTRQVVRWHRPEQPPGFRAYIVLMSDGGIFAIFFAKREITEAERLHLQKLNERARAYEHH